MTHPASGPANRSESRPMTLVLIGATGATGRQVLALALERGDEVVAYVRSPYKLEDLQGRPGLTVVPGQLTDVERMARAMAGADAVVVALGPPARPSTALRCTLMRRSLPAVAEAMERAGLRRAVVLSAWGVGATARTASAVVQAGFATLMRAVFRDHEEAEEPLRGRLDLTTVHPVILTDDEDQPTLVRPDSGVEHVRGVPRVSRAAVARALLDAAHDEGTIGERLIVQPRQ